VGTWSHPEINTHWIAGTIPDLERLADLIEQSVAQTRIGQFADVGTQYAPSAPCKLVLEVREDGFDPAAADPGCR
jgi:hypothetical protein